DLGLLRGRGTADLLLGHDTKMVDVNVSVSPRERRALILVDAKFLSENLESAAATHQLRAAPISTP
ncbi:MAG: hypothetical protein WB440_04480, partial [Steroidobacteraceae bacterium]